MRFPGYKGDSGASLGMTLRLKPFGFEYVGWNAEIVKRQRKRVMSRTDETPAILVNV